MVQGVGFRPAVCRLGRALGLAGFVRNDHDGATIEVQGEPEPVATFERVLPARLPPRARLVAVEVHTVAAEPGAVTFDVGPTLAGARGAALVPPDAALCPACRAELDDADDRRHRYAFVNCTDCGPRFSLVHSLPYDRERTSMACFPLCPLCAAEYGDVGARRFHAEAICCPDCGPHVRLVDAHGQQLGSRTAAMARVRARLGDGAIVAIKGLGGFQLACRADDAAAVARLRGRKHRPAKPFAVMVKDLAVAARLVELDAAAAALLQGPVAPIVLLPQRTGASLAPNVAPGLGELGVMLPTTPLHVELFRDAPYEALVATSGNHSDEPICLGNREALHRLAGLADAFLLHDRDIVRRVDDSVVRYTPGDVVVVRRARGYVPEPLRLPVATPAPLLAVGAHLQVTACLALDGEAFVSQHVGDLDGEASRAFLAEVAAGLEQFLEVQATVIVADTHPDYASARWAEALAVQRGARLCLVPHHLAHAAAVLGEHGAWPLPGQRALALVLDGTGHGVDGAAWGHELLALDHELGWSRLGWGEALPLVGGEAAVREPWRVVVAALARHGGEGLLAHTPLAAAIDDRRRETLVALARSGGWPLAHGAGRLFEAAGALLGVGVRNEYEGQAAARLEALAAAAPVAVVPWPEVQLPPDRPQVPHAALLLAVAQRTAAGEAKATVAAGLFTTFAALCVRLVQRIDTGGSPIAIGGGCLVNRLLRRELASGFAAVGRRVLLPQVLPPGDGAIAYGQAALVAAGLARGNLPHYLGSAATTQEVAPCASPSRCS
ncbi:MAG: carbamoyltransferase HypF [Planctomycetes bacterium]|nr:carbamoyltransferase HypF [Planctomycetota bacterium]